MYQKIDDGLVEYLTTEFPLRHKIKKVLICRPNHRLGNLLLIGPIIQEVVEIFPNSKIDLFVKGTIGVTLFENFKNVCNIIQLPRKPLRQLKKYLQGWLMIQKNHYDLVINVVPVSKSGRLSALITNASHKIFGDERDGSPPVAEKHVAVYPVYNLRKYLARFGFIDASAPVPNLLLKLNSLEIAEGKKILRNVVGNDRLTICLYTYATGKKCFATRWWVDLYNQLRELYPTYNIIEILPLENISRIAFRAPTFYSKNLREIGAVISNAQLFISADCGIMHLASAVGVPTVGLFSVTDKSVFGPYNETSVAIDTNHCGIDDIIKVVGNVLTRRP
jgi:heptosyltransferase III